MKRLIASILLIPAFLATKVEAWPANSYPRIFQDARRPQPQALATFLKDFESVLMSPCRAVPLEESVQKAIAEAGLRGVRVP